ncbi:MarR family winged helix-turn-helix transcriptional regulator [Clostridium ljungdahlii]|uniref:HTH-type transcriptional regulator TcaR n=1 Tax=Clostridium ljungdahlii TaxID=1538 RepID=A0A168LY87_9CLOT|nr:MarR family transcriptional regulator [Clostridium ljungdahlii]OAA83859.1 HTH-type transcriptional regulator TcaR [Clostridium ljungdahlii]
MNCAKDKLSLIEDVKKSLYDFVIISRSMINEINYEEKLSISQLLLLYLLEESESYKVSELAEKLGITPSAVTNLSNKLVESQFINRFRPEDNRRVVMISLTDKGKQFLKKMSEVKYRFWEEALSELNNDDLKNMSLSFLKLNYALQKYKNRK